MLMPRIRTVRTVRVVSGHCLYLTFSDGVTGEVDLRDQMVGRGGVFAALEDPAYFGRVAVDADVGTVVWPNGVDLDPDVLYAATIANRQPAASEA